MLSKLDELMVQIAQVHVRIFVNHLGEIRVVVIPVALIHFLNSSSDGGSGENDLSLRFTLLDQLILSGETVEGLSHSMA